MNQKLTLILVVLLALAAFSAGIFWTRLQTLEKKQEVETSQLTPSSQAQPLSLDNLKKYALELGLETEKFNTCLDEGGQKKNVQEDIAQGESLGVRGTPAFFVNGRFLGGAFSFLYFREIIDKELSGKGSTNLGDYSLGLQEAAKKGSFNPKPVKVEIGEDNPVKGPSSAKITLVEFSDFQCPFCLQALPTVKQILQAYPNDVRFVYEQFPLVSLHAFAQKAAEASLCAQEQGKFWEYHDKLFQSQGTGQ